MSLFPKQRAVQPIRELTADAAFYKVEALRYYWMYRRAQDECKELERKALEAAENYEPMQDRLLSDPTTEAGFKYKSEKGKRDSYMAAAQLNATMAQMLEIVE